MRTLPEEDAVTLYRRVRTGADYGTILDHYQTGDLLLQMHLVPETRLRYELPYSRDMPLSLIRSGSPYLKSMIYEAASQRALCSETHPTANAADGIFPAFKAPKAEVPYVRPYHSAVFVEPRLEKVSPSEWTTVSRDDTLMRDLLPAYFTHECHLWPVFHKDYFLEDMATDQTQRRRSLCCSPLLVNAILAYACYFYKHIPDRFRYWEPENLGYRFLAEAKRMWETQALNGKRRNLTSIQAAMIINIVYNLYGLDKLGTIYGLQSLSLVGDMPLFEGNTHIMSERVRHARNFTAWCLFNIDSHLGWQFFRPPFLLESPEVTLPDPSSNPAWYGEIWGRYPLSPTLSPTYFAHDFKAISDFRVILGELCRATFGKEPKLETKQAMMFVRRMTDWFKDLPSPLTPKYIVLPAHFLMHLDYHIILMTTCQPFIQDEWNDGPNPGSLIADTERDMNVLIRLYYFRHGFADAQVYLTAPLSKLGFVSLQAINGNENISPKDLEYWRSSLFLALRGLREKGRNYYITRTSYYILKNQLKPEEAHYLAGRETSASAADESPGLVGEIQSAWVPRIVDISDDPVAEELSKLAKEYSTSEFGEQSDDGSGYESNVSLVAG